jgi:hypothetical protein
MHYLLFYDVAEDYMERRVPFRAAHLRYARESHAAPRGIGPLEQFADSLLGVRPEAERRQILGENHTLRKALKAAEVDPGIVIFPAENVDSGMVITPPDSVDPKMIIPGESWELWSRRLGQKSLP